MRNTGASVVEGMRELLEKEELVYTVSSLKIRHVFKIIIFISPNFDLQLKINCWKLKSVSK